MAPLKVGSLFAGYGGLDLGIQQVLDAETEWFCEFDEAPSKILKHHWPEVPNLGDVTKVNWADIPPVDIIAGGSPCQDLSQAGKRAGMTEGTRSNLWVNMREAIAVIKPRLVVWENVRGALSASATSDSDMEHPERLLGGESAGHLRALGRVLGDLTDLGYDTRWTTLRASDIGAPHHRARVFLIAWPCDSVLHPGHDAGRAELGKQHEVQASGSGEPGQDPADTQGGRGISINDSSWCPPACREGNGRTDGGYRSEVAAHADCFGLEKGHLIGRGNEKEVTVVNGSGQAFPHPANNGHERAWSPREGGPGSSDCHNRTVEWGEYAPAVRRWERVVGPAPAPTELNSKGNPRLNAAFAEWMMGLLASHVTAPEIGLTRAEQLKAIGNGVVPQQAAAALRILLGSDF